MSKAPFAIFSHNIITPQGSTSGYLIVEAGLIKEIAANKPDMQIIEAADQVVMPGVIDPHVHINEPGRTDWEGFTTATQAAAAGGVTTLVDMPLNSTPVTTSKDHLQEKIKAAEGKMHVNVGFWGGLVPGSQQHLADLLRSGVLGIKVFLCPSGISDFPEVAEHDLRLALPLLSEKQLPLLVHAELTSPVHIPSGLPATEYETYLKTRPPAWELDAINLMIGLCKEFQTPVHIVHLAAAEALPLLASAKNEAPITVETCPHYLCLASEDIPSAQTQFKCAPPIRSRENNQLLWEGLMSETIDFIASDHSPAPAPMKCLEEGDFLKAWGGISSIQFSLPLIWTLGMSRNLSLQLLSQWLCAIPAKFLGLDHCKGHIAPGYHADLVIWDPQEAFTITPEVIHFKHKITPYMNRQLKGVVKRTYIGGQLAFSEQGFADPPIGQIILR